MSTQTKCKYPVLIKPLPTQVCSY